MKHLPFLLSLENSPAVIETLKSEFELKPHEVDRAKSLLQKGYPPLVRADMLAYMLGVSNGLIVSLSRFQEKNYRIYEVKKAGGGTRVIEAPRSYLKMIQRWIYDYVLSRAELPTYVTGFVRGKDIFRNADIHLKVKKKNLMVVDIKDFFPSINERRVFRVFREFGFPVKVSYTLAGLCTLEKRLPQGAPTSPMLANIAFLPVDVRLEGLARTWGCAYSRYADDIAFSGAEIFSRKDMDEVVGIIRDERFEINDGKSRIIGSGGRQVVAGLVVNQIGQPLRKKRMFWRSRFRHAEQEPREFSEKVDELKGVVAYINRYDSELAKKYSQVIEKIERCGK
jgi:RNA-directed DNA polymerase